MLYGDNIVVDCENRAYGKYTVWSKYRAFGLKLDGIYINCEALQA